MAKKLDEDEKSFLRMLAEKDELDEKDCVRVLQIFSDAQEGHTERQTEIENEKLRSSAFLTRMSHDIRTPLNGIVGMLEIAEKNKDNIELMHDCFEKIRMSVSNLLLLINDILDMHKLESGKIETEDECFNLNELIVNATEMVLPLARAHNVALRVVSARGIRHPHLIGKSGYIRQIYTNLVTNAIKYNKPNGSVHIEVDELTSDEEKGMFRFSVEDTGIGMSEEFLRHVFDPFTQEQKDARTTYRGSGLGLSICKKLIELMGGTVGVTSTQGKGSCFVVTLPIEIDRTPQGEAHHAEAERISLAGLRVLLVEDNELNAEIAVYMLSEMGAEVVWAENGQVAMDWFRKSETGEISLILMDLMMPVKNGIETAREIRALAREDAQTVPIIAMTANALESDVKNCMDAGMNAHMAKPFDSTMLYRKIREFVTLPTECMEEKTSVHVELHKELRYGLTAAEKSAGMKEYNHPLFMSQQFFMAACWEINTARASVAILKSTLHSQLTGRQTGYEQLFEEYAAENVAPQDAACWRENMSLAALRGLRREKHIVLSMGALGEAYREYDLVLVPSFDAAGKTEVVYFSAAEKR